MTPERLEEIRRRWSHEYETGYYIVNELLAEVDRLTRINHELQNNVVAKVNEIVDRYEIVIRDKERTA